jgi:hypothetical protein
MTGADIGEDGLEAPGTARISLHGVIDRRDLFPEPAINRDIALFESPEPCPDNLTGRSIRSGGNKPVNEGGVFLRQTDGALLDVGHDDLLPFLPKPITKYELFILFAIGTGELPVEGCGANE